jgi:hypothetical protein
VSVDPFAGYTAADLLARFWEWRVRGRPLQTLRQDLGFFLDVWQHKVGRETCVEVYRMAMLGYEDDLAKGGLAPSLPSTEPRKPMTVLKEPRAYVGRPT